MHRITGTLLLICRTVTHSSFLEHLYMTMTSIAAFLNPHHLSIIQIDLMIVLPNQVHRNACLMLIFDEISYGVGGVWLLFFVADYVKNMVPARWRWLGAGETCISSQCSWGFLELRYGEPINKSSTSGVTHESQTTTELNAGLRVNRQEYRYNGRQ